MMKNHSVAREGSGGGGGDEFYVSNSEVKIVGGDKCGF